MKMINKTIKVKKGISLMVLGGVALLAAVFAMPMQQANADNCSKSRAMNSLITDFSSATLVCVSRSEVLETLGLNATSDPTSVKATLCHIPPGNPANQHTITVGQSSVNAHMAHGDVMGACSNWVSEAYINSRPTCTAFHGGTTTPGVWIPDVAVTADDAPSLNAYFSQVQAGSITGLPDSSGESYREVRGQ
ncbi:MAG: hypothetical protein COW19_00295 [Zetaproteobacteria bacterium CG12_big_fil_rev_8_21_14_0_65_55_1124]|nr:MAG: hypothetical protein AUJ58_02775 [Zetaproteobacteria bacterium CG1_02_55_237]PIS18751.1 MAG: hypothetical protein COT53_09420 [Zetaproteobacteria bacterium CG08_land_8_20_14_0_20_55_17]PIW43984.1 MAG: hypothetical protein COW19_00295 [Zetaproteobacteria bacterium CG12_big_fil_rev_8_21_14_0_65_55_1124]PIY52479.1 MAG: hypothetical protein COZ01_07740 [Zetaproteobacteria bacterium CG_4_10_14_0_8_um_filter_55_43]PIZ36757.1 MAG: hypothetical protein COY36_11405 [Zetaproteobacteria bacterium 